MSDYIQILTECQAQNLGLIKEELFLRDSNLLAEWQAQALKLARETPSGIELGTNKTAENE